MLRVFQRDGLEAFDPDGSYGGMAGEQVISKMTEIFEQAEMYTDCAYLRDLCIAHRDNFC